MSDLVMFGARGPRAVETQPRPDLKSTSHAVTCDYLVGRGLRVCSCRAVRAGS